VDYSDLVNVEFTATYDTLKMDWGALWLYDYGYNPAAYWWDLARKHMSFQNAVPSLNVWDYISFDMDGFAAELVSHIINKVILPNVDPHPEYRGHAVLKRAFTNALGMVKYEPNGGQHYYGAVLYPGEKLAYTVPARWGHYFGGWYADASLRRVFDHARTDYADPATSFTLADLVDGSAVKAKVPKTTTLYAKWPDKQ
jgi:hypothetical protein